MSLTLQNNSITPAQVQHLRKASGNQYNIRNKQTQGSRQLSTFQSPQLVFTPASGSSTIRVRIQGRATGISAFITDSLDTNRRLYLVKGNTLQLVESATQSEAFYTATVVPGPNSNTIVLYTQQQGSAVKLYARTVSSSLSLGSKVEIGTAAASTTHIAMISMGSGYMVIWNNAGKYQAQPVTSSLQSNGAFNANYGTDANYLDAFALNTFQPLTFLKEGTVAGPKYIIRKPDGIYTGTATSSGLGSQTKINPSGNFFACPDIIKGPDGTIVAAWGQRSGDGTTSLVYVQKLSQSLTTVGSPVALLSETAGSSAYQVQLTGFSDGYLVVLSSYDLKLTAIHISKNLEIKGVQQDISPDFKYSGSFNLQSSDPSFNVHFFARPTLDYSISPRVYNLPGTFSLPAGASPTTAPTPSSGNNNNPTPAPTTTPSPTRSPTQKPSARPPKVHLKGSPENPILIGSPDVQEILEGYRGGQTVMDGEGTLRTDTAKKIVLPGTGEGDTYKIINGPGEDRIVYFAIEKDTLDLSAVGIKSLDDFKDAVQNRGSLLQIEYDLDGNGKNYDRKYECIVQCPNLIPFGTFLCHTEDSNEIRLKFDKRIVTIETGCFRPSQIKYADSNQESTSTIIIGVIVGVVGLIAALFAVYKCLNHKGDAKINPNAQNQEG